MASSSGEAPIQQSSDLNGLAMFSGAAIENLNGGHFYTVGRDLIMNAPPREDEEVEVVLKILRKHVDTKTWEVHQHVSSTRAPDTGEEFDASEDMEQWRTTPRGFFWATGGPGAGKTHLASSIFDRLTLRTKDDEDAVVVITYLRYNDDTTDWDTVMGFLIHLVEAKPLPSVLQIIKAGFAEHETKRSKPTFEQLSQIFRAVVRKYKRCYIIVDGLDESKYEIQMMLINLLATLDANILLMSRDMKLFQDRLQALRSNRAVLKTVAAHDKDLDRYITHVIDTNPRLAQLLADPEKQEKLRTIAKRNAGGMFLHLSLQMQALKDCLDLRSIFALLNTFPTGVDALYLTTLERIARQPPDHADRARLALAWILYSNRPLLVADALHAIAVSPEYEVEQDRIICEGDLAMICCGLVAVDHKTRRVRLVHETAQHYLGELLRKEIPRPHQMMALTCMKLLEQAGFTNSLISTLEALNTAFSTTPLLEYAYRSVGHHIREGLKENPSFLSQILDFLRSCKSFPYHHSLFDPVNIQLLSPLHVTALLDLPRMVSKLLREKNVDLNIPSRVTRGGRGWSPLTLACVEGHCDVVQNLLGFSHIQANDGDLTPLMAASSQGHGTIVQALLKCNTRVERALASASRFVGTSTRARFIDVNRVNELGETALMMALRKGHTPVVSSLLGAPDVDIKVRSKRGDSAYVMAIKGNHLGIIQLFHNTPNLEVNAQYIGGMTPLMFASEMGNVEVVKMILDVPDLDLTLRNCVGHTALSLASWRGHANILELFLAIPGIDPDLCRASKDQQLILAAEKGDAKIVEFLLTVPGIDVNLCDKDGNSALMQASRRGQTEVVELLLAAPGVDVNLGNKYGDSALMRASYEGRTVVVKLLLAAPGVDLNLCNKNGNSALLRASFMGHTEVVKLLLAAPGIDLDIRNAQGASALERAKSRGKWKVVELLEAALSQCSR